MANPDASGNATIDAQVAEIFPAECIEECALLQGLVTRFKDFTAINAEKDLKNTDNFVFAMASARLSEEKTAFADDLAELAGNCRILNNQSTQETGE